MQKMLEITSKPIYCTFIQYIEVTAMLNINKLNLHINNNNLITSSLVKPTTKSTKNTQWCNVVNISSTYDISKNYQTICQNYHADHKWILMVNPDDKPLEQLSASGKINPERILKVNANKVNINFLHIKSTLLKGTCSAIILTKAVFTQAELNELSQCAEQGKTQCILLQHSNTEQQNKLH